MWQSLKGWGEERPGSFDGLRRVEQRTLTVEKVQRAVRVFIFFAFLELLASASAWATDVDWKVYSFPSFEGPQVCFYDEHGISRTSEQHVKVWTKCLLQKDLDGVDSESELRKKIIRNAAIKVDAGYIPPIALVENVDFDQAIVIKYEQTADVADLPIKAQFFYELNCSERMDRRLSTRIHSKNGDGADNKPSEWRYTPPEGGGAYLMNILCGKR